MLNEVLVRKLHTGATGTAVGETVMLDGCYGTAVVQITGITTATVTFQGSIDGSTFVNLMGKNVTTVAAGVTATANGIYVIPITGLMKFRANISAHTTGTVVVDAVCVPIVDSVYKTA